MEQDQNEMKKKLMDLVNTSLISIGLVLSTAGMIYFIYLLIRFLSVES